MTFSIKEWRFKHLIMEEDLEKYGLKESVNEATANYKKVPVEAKRIEPSRLATEIVEIIESELGISIKKFNQHFSSSVDEQGIEFRAEYSPYYQQDPKWYSYADVKIDKNLYDNKSITSLIKELRKIKKIFKESVNEGLSTSKVKRIKKKIESDRDFQKYFKDTGENYDEALRMWLEDEGYSIGIGSEKEAEELADAISQLPESVNEDINVEKALEWNEPYEVIPELIAAALEHVKPADYYELLDLFNEYNIILDIDSDSSRSEILNVIKHSNWDAFQDDSEIIQLQDYIEKIIGPF